MLGPMIAARSVSSLRLDFGAEEKVVIRMTRDRDYPPASAVPLPPPDAAKAVRLADPSPDDLRHFAAMVATSGSPFVPPFLARPGMAADMLAAGHLHAILALGGDWIVGGVLWRPLTDTCIELYGPYLFSDDPDDSDADHADGRGGRPDLAFPLPRPHAAAGAASGARAFFRFPGRAGNDRDQRQCRPGHLLLPSAQGRERRRGLLHRPAGGVSRRPV